MILERLLTAVVAKSTKKYSAKHQNVQLINGEFYLRKDNRFYDCSITPDFDILVRHYDEKIYSREEAIENYKSIIKII